MIRILVPKVNCKAPNSRSMICDILRATIDVALQSLYRACETVSPGLHISTPIAYRTRGHLSALDMSLLNSGAMQTPPSPSYCPQDKHRSAFAGQN